MKKYIKGNRIINATDKAYNLLYKQQGFVALENKSQMIDRDITEKEYRALTNNEMIELLGDNGITDIPSRPNKDDLTSIALTNNVIVGG